VVPKLVFPSLGLLQRNIIRSMGFVSNLPDLYCGLGPRPWCICSRLFTFFPPPVGRRPPPTTAGFVFQPPLLLFSFPGFCVVSSHRKLPFCFPMRTLSLPSPKARFPLRKYFIFCFVTFSSILCLFFYGPSLLGMFGWSLFRTKLFNDPQSSPPSSFCGRLPFPEKGGRCFKPFFPPPLLAIESLFHQ